MRKILIIGGALAVLFVLLILLAGRRAGERGANPVVVTEFEIPSAPPGSASEAHQGFLYGRITTEDGATYEGRLRFGGGEEAFWGDYFNGYKDENPWAVHVPPEQLRESHPLEIFGFRIADREHQIPLGRPFMVRFGDIAQIEALGRDIRVTLKNGTVFDLDRLNADDFADGVRVWDGQHGVVDFHERRIHSIDLLPTARLGAAPDRLRGTVRTRQGDFTGFIQWNRAECTGSDKLDGKSADGELSLRFDTIRSIARDSRDSSRVTLLDSREIELSGTSDVGDGNRGVFVDDQRYGRVLIPWEAFERVDFSPGGSGPAFDDFQPGHPLTGSVTTRSGDGRTGRRLTGRLVFDLDETETTETLDAPSRGVTYTILFGLIASIVPSGREERGTRHARVILLGGEELPLEPSGDLGERNAGMLIFVDGSERPEYVPWSDVERIDLDRPTAM